MASCWTMLLTLIEWRLVRTLIDFIGLPPTNLEWDMKLWWAHNEAMIALLMAYKANGDIALWESFKKVTDYSYSHVSEIISMLDSISRFLKPFDSIFQFSSWTRRTVTGSVIWIVRAHLHWLSKVDHTKAVFTCQEHWCCAKTFWKNIFDSFYHVEVYVCIHGVCVFLIALLIYMDSWLAYEFKKEIEQS